MRRTAATVLLAAALALASCSNSSDESKAAAKPRPSPTIDKAGQFITASQDLNFSGRHPSSDELLAFPPKWCKELQAGHSVACMFDLTGPDLYPYAADWGMKKSDAYRLLVAGVLGYCPKYADQVTQELRESGDY
ncbi:hypothetical protein ABZ890_45585 [Streptomyces sp. NPDC046984]|uniref:hypothetical protein n=1 Tax=Streptomyces sp. NPDC046984 TaxID=3155138 RepID=UPI0033E99BDC